ncbi:MAG: hypothetical protein OEW99_10475 [Gammaproteobacteria bacterium]|nr:hypothetical protein [Gammaproteobacteria bacterium]MDH5370441.1 hypothetical protein [Gammaproteobacteria bacterium]MDH5659790.1 hypothetical protein [Gammaproteobacteria bacterium]
MRKPVEIVKGEKSLRLNLYLIIASYLLLIILVEPAIDFFLLSFFEAKNVGYIDQLNKLKLVVSSIIYTVIGSIPAIFATWFGYRIVASSKLPPVLLSGKTRFPFTVVVIKGRIAKMFGVLTIIISLVLIFQLFLHLVKVLSL